jgi:RNA polymerase sigma factor (sigma-70 family)
MHEELNIQLKDKRIIEGLEGSNITSSVELLYEHYFNSVVEFVVYKDGSEDDGADIFQESILVLIDQIRSGKFRGESSLKTFLIAIARNLWLMELRTRDRRKKREQVYYSNEPVIDDSSLLNKKVADLQPIFGKIGEVCRNILVGFYFENKSMKLLLQEFDFKNEQVLRNRKNACMKKFKEILSEDKNLLQTLKSDYNL